MGREGMDFVCVGGGEGGLHISSVLLHIKS